MASSVHPFQPGNTVPYTYGAPNTPGYVDGGAPSAYPVAGVHGTQAYPVGGYGYGAPSLAGYNAPGSVPSGAYQGASPGTHSGLGYGAPGFNSAASGYAPSYPVGAPGYVPGAPPGQYPPGDDGSVQGHPIGAARGAPGYGYSGSAVVYPVGGTGAPENAGGGSGGGDDHKGFADQQQQQPPVNPRDQIQTGRWAAGLCSCCDNCVPNCAAAMCLPFLPLAQIYARLGLMAYRAALVHFFLLYIAVVIANFLPSKKSTTSSSTKYSSRTRSYTTTSAVSIPIPAFVLVGVLGQLALRIYVWRARAAIRKRFNIPGSCCGDCCTVTWCSCCAIAQMATHVKSYTPGNCSFEGPDVLPAYSS